MSEQYDPKACYDLLDPERIKVGELRQGRYFEGAWEVGTLEGDVFHYNGEPAGKLEGLTLTRNGPPGELTQCQLVRQR
ncbi:hypothetical protein [Pseudomonas moorei]|uniref:Uncharacterized protein n=1 Tax=Pseudomonas moorei TaxID=395599 RepID=A0A1H1EIH7_9PSED|nr:hypothetical protein [Pseudomonas moorei]KAB0507759.1 hypothetical protein F7R06_06290 [Pseudomonas moorei]SDQ88424.1 hypothetical protein SAMN04490195_2212 [Pseudomonas moorei]